jgi:two-component system, NtrC family, response regulator PilR
MLARVVALCYLSVKGFFCMSKHQNITFYGRVVMPNGEDFEDDIAERTERIVEGEQAKSSQILIGNSSVMRNLKNLLQLVARNDSTVLLYGETGSGKEAAVNYIHAHYHGKGRLVVIDCAALNDSMAEAELFGHAKGAFTGAITERSGLFQEAQDGIAFFDEVGEIPLHMQPKFLRLTEDKTVRQIGSNRSSKVKVKIVAGTNRNLVEEIKAGTFRQDLHARLNVVALRMPSLREHTEDIPVLVDHFLEQFMEPISISHEALEFLTNYSWPDNVRQLRSALERAVTFCQNRPNGVLTLEKVDFLFLQERSLVPTTAVAAPVPSMVIPTSLKDIGKSVAQRAEAEWLAKMLVQCHGNRKQVARISGLSYKAVLNKIKKYGLRLASVSVELPITYDDIVVSTFQLPGTSDPVPESSVDTKAAERASERPNKSDREFSRVESELDKLSSISGLFREEDSQ